MALAWALLLLGAGGRAAAAATGPPSAGSAPFPAGYNNRAKTPPMGWRTWNAFHQFIDQPTLTSYVHPLTQSARGRGKLAICSQLFLREFACDDRVIDAMVSKNRSIAGENGLVSLAELGYSSFGN